MTTKTLLLEKGTKINARVRAAPGDRYFINTGSLEFLK
jgi:hypothetical protein